MQELQGELMVLGGDDHQPVRLASPSLHPLHPRAAEPSGAIRDRSILHGHQHLQFGAVEMGDDRHGRPQRADRLVDRGEVMQMHHARGGDRVLSNELRPTVDLSSERRIVEIDEDPIGAPGLSSYEACIGTAADIGSSPWAHRSAAGV